MRQARVYAVAGTHECVVGDQVGRGEAQFAAALIAMDDLTTHLERSAEETRGLLYLTGEHQSSDVARGDDLTGDLEQGRPTRGEALVFGEHLRIALGAIAEAEVLADRHVACAERVDEHVVDELTRAALGEVCVESDHDQLLYAKCLHQLGLHLQRGEQLGRVLGRHDRRRVWVKREHAVRATYHLAVAEMDAIEGAHSHAPLPWLHVGQPSDLHGRSLRHAELGRPRRERSLASKPSAAASACSTLGSGGSVQIYRRGGGVLAASASHGPIAVRLNSSQYASPRSAIKERT